MTNTPPLLNEEDIRPREDFPSYFTKVQETIDKYSHNEELNEFLRTYPWIYKLFNKGKTADQYAYKHPLNTSDIHSLQGHYGPQFIESWLQLAEHMREELKGLREGLVQTTSLSWSETDEGDKQKVAKFGTLLAWFGYGIKELNKDSDIKNKLIGDRGMILQIEQMPKEQRMIPIITKESTKESLQWWSIFSSYKMLEKYEFLWADRQTIKKYDSFTSMDTLINNITTAIEERLNTREKELLSYKTPNTIGEAKIWIIDTFTEWE